jgi:hypothetical protein
MPLVGTKPTCRCQNLAIGCADNHAIQTEVDVRRFGDHACAGSALIIGGTHWKWTVTAVSGDSLTNATVGGGGIYFKPGNS